MFKATRDQITMNTTSINNHAKNFNTIAQAIAMLAENINMQMEAEYADLIDRNLTALYGIQKIEPEQKGKRAVPTLKRYEGDVDDIVASQTDL